MLHLAIGRDDANLEVAFREMRRDYSFWLLRSPERELLAQTTQPGLNIK
jgi:hypothetical protein